MTSTDQKVTRRRHPRFSLKGCTFIADQKIGRIVNVSQGGMAFYYADREPWPHNAAQAGSLHCQDNLVVLNLPIETISDIELPHNYSDGSMTVRRRSVRFGQLTPPQQEQLDKLIARVDFPTPPF